MRDQAAGFPQTIIDFASHSSEHGGGVDEGSTKLAAFFLGLQEAWELQGHCLEIGVKEGRYLSLMAARLRHDETLVGIDPYFDMPWLKLAPKANLESLTDAAGRLTMIHKDSREVTPDELRGACREDFRYVHIDGNHEEAFVLSDLHLAEAVLAPGGVIVLDDFFHFSGVGVSAALAQFFQDKPKSQLVPLLANAPKFYLTTACHLEKYRAAFLEQYDRDRRPVMRTTWFQKPLISTSLGEQMPARLESPNASTQANAELVGKNIDPARRRLAAVSCPMCGHHGHKKLVPSAKVNLAREQNWERHPSIHLCACQHCGLVYESPQIVIEDSEAYAQDYYYNARNPVASHDDLQRRLAAYNWYVLRNSLPWTQVEEVLNVGAAGAWLDWVRTKIPSFKRGVLVEPSPQAIANCELRYPELEAELGVFETYEAPDASFDLVTFFSSFYSITKPKQALAKVRRLLKPGGHLVISYSYLGMELDFAHEGEAGLTLSHQIRGVPIIYYSRRSARTMLEVCGFEVVEESTFEIPDWEPSGNAGRQIFYLVARPTQQARTIEFAELANPAEVQWAEAFYQTFCERITHNSIKIFATQLSPEQRSQFAEEGHLYLVHDGDYFYAEWARDQLAQHGLKALLMDGSYGNPAKLCAQLPDRDGVLVMTIGEMRGKSKSIAELLRHARVLNASPHTNYAAFKNWVKLDDGQTIIARPLCPSLGTNERIYPYERVQANAPAILTEAELGYEDIRGTALSQWVIEAIPRLAGSIATHSRKLQSQARAALLKPFVVAAQQEVAANAYASEYSGSPLKFPRIASHVEIEAGLPLHPIRPVVQAALLRSARQQVRELLVHAHKHGADVSTQPPIPTIESSGPSTLINIVRQAFERVLAPWIEARPRVIIYGAGLHTRWIFDHTKITEVNVVALVDDRGASCPAIGGYNVQGLEALTKLQADIILVSSPRYQEQMQARLIDMKLDGPKIVVPYSDDFRPVAQLAFTPR